MTMQNSWRMDDYERIIANTMEEDDDDSCIIIEL